MKTEYSHGLTCHIIVPADSPTWSRLSGSETELKSSSSDPEKRKEGRKAPHHGTPRSHVPPDPEKKQRSMAQQRVRHTGSAYPYPSHLRAKHKPWKPRFHSNLSFPVTVLFPLTKNQN